MALLKWGVSKSDSFFDRKLKLVLKKNFACKVGKIAFYHEALRHKSFFDAKKKPTLKSNERLEFLGDSLLGAFVAAYLFAHFPNEDEGFLTKTRSKIVNRIFLNQLAIDLQVNQLIKYSLPKNQFSNAIYGNALEALFGAIYLDNGADRLFKVFEHVFKAHIDLENIKQNESDYKSRLFEYIQKERLSITLEVVNEQTENSKKLFTVKVSVGDTDFALGTGSSKKKAEQEACKLLLEKFEPSIT